MRPEEVTVRRLSSARAAGQIGASSMSAPLLPAETTNSISGCARAAASKGVQSESRRLPIEMFMMRTPAAAACSTSSGILDMWWRG